MRKQIKFGPETFLNDIKDPFVLLTSVNLSPIGLSGCGKIGSGRVGFYDAEYHSCSELFVVLLLLLEKSFFCIRHKGL